MINPFLELRDRAGLSQNECAKLIGVDVRAIARLEHGLYTNPLPAAIDYWVSKGHPLPELLTGYEDYVFQTRQSNHRIFAGLHVNLTDPTHPFRNLRSPHSLTETVKLMCVPLDTLQFWEKKWRTQQSVPKSILLALNQMGYSQLELTKFQDTYQAWRSIHLKDVKPIYKPKRKTSVKVTASLDNGNVGSS